MWITNMRSRRNGRLGDLGHTEEYETGFDCPACGTSNRRVLLPRDHRCWNCGSELPLIPRQHAVSKSSADTGSIALREAS